MLFQSGDRIVENTEHMFNVLAYHIRRHPRVRLLISTYMCFIPSGISFVENFISTLKENGTSVRMLVGLDRYGTTSSIDKVMTDSRRICPCAVFVPDMHMKAFVFSDDWCVFGGRNMSVSRSTDLTVFAHSTEIADYVRRETGKYGV